MSLFDTMMEVLGYQLNYTRHTGIDQQPLGMSSPAVAPYGDYLTADGHTVVMGTTHDLEWQRLARNVIDRPDLADDSRFATNSQRAEHRSNSTRRSPSGVGDTSWRISSGSPTRRASATPGTTASAK